MKAYVGHRMRTVFPITQMEIETGKSNDTLRRWERNGVIPKATHRDRQGRRYYLKEEIEVLAQLIKKHELNKQGRAITAAFKKDVRETWRRYRAI